VTRILGIDPGSTVTGDALIDVRGTELVPADRGCLDAPAALPFHERILRIADALGRLIDDRRPGEAAVEDLFHAVNTRSALQLAHVRGAILVELARRRVDLFTYSPRTVKKALTGTGSAEKGQVRGMVERLTGLHLAGESDDVSDALAVAICHAHWRRRVQA
jgi:crossover junction endodeoxyribonuclease RuvC